MSTSSEYPADATESVEVMDGGEDVEDIYPLSAMQQGLLLHSRLDDGAGVYLQQVRLTLSGPLDTARLRRAWEQLVARHPVLRTGVVWEGLAEPVQLVGGRCTLPWSELDCAELSEHERDTRLGELLAADRARPLDLARPPLMRLHLLRWGPAEHTLLWSVHHLVVDGWSMPLLLAELATCYAGGTPAPVRPFRDYIAWLQRAEHAAAESFWTRELTGFTAPTRLGRVAFPDAEPDLPAAEAPAECELELDTASSTALTHAARSAGLTLNTVIQGCWALLLSIYSGHNDVVFGATVSGRPGSLPGAESMIGPFIHSLPVRAAIEPERSTVDWLRALQDRQAEARQHELLPLAKIQANSELAPGAALFDTLIGVENYPAGSTELRGPDGPVDVRLRGGRFHSHYPLTLLFVPGPRLAMHALYDRRLLGTATVDGLLRGLRTLFAGIAADPHRPVSALSCVDDDARGDIFARHTAPAAAHPSLVHAWEQAVARFGQRIAVHDDGRELSYAEADRLAGRIAAAARDAGAGRGRVVAVCLPRSVQLVAALLGVLKTGAAYLPLDPDHPSARLRAAATDTGVAAVITSRALAERHPGLAGHTVLVEDLPAEPLRAGAPPGADDLAYVLFTSGSTGRPKGVEVTHGNVTALLAATAPGFRFDEHDVWTMFHSAAFDFSVWEMWGALAHGSRLVVVPFEVSRNPAGFTALLRDRGVTVLNQTPSAFRALAAAVDAPLTRLRWVIFGGEELDPRDLRGCFDTAGEGAAPVNMYGITETTVHVTWQRVHRDAAESGGRGIGEALPGVVVRVLDARGRLVPDGVLGELYVGGTGVARGYRGRPELDAQRFVADEFGAGRLYRTGDLGRWLPGGTLEYHGRVDAQVQLRGFRIEPGEIEAALAAHDGVAQAAVTLVGAGEGSRLAAFVVPAPSTAAPVRRLLAATEERQRATLPDGSTVFIANTSETDFMAREIFTDRTYLRGGIVLPDNAVVVDVGANIGLFALFVAQNCADPTVFALEPLPPLQEILRANLDLHGIAGRVLPVGAGRAEDTVAFGYYRHATVLSGRYADPGEERDLVRTFLLGQLTDQGVELDDEVIEELLTERLRTESYDCRVRPLSAILDEHGIEHVDLLKIDVEKGELDVLGGLRAADFARIEQIVLEVHDVHDRLRVIRDMLAAHGYDIEVHRDPHLADTALRNVYARRASTRPASTGPPRTWRSGAALVADIRRRLAENLPYYMIPETIEPIGALPLTPNGKLDRAALAGTASAQQRRADYVAPGTDTERTLAAIWSQLLRVDRVGAADNFFAIGGHSLLATQVLTRIRDELSVSLPLAEVFARPVLSALAEGVERYRANAMRD